MMGTYAEPSAFAEYKKTRKWPDGAQIVKELSLIKIGDDCHKVTFACSTPAGAGIFEDHFIGVGMIVKDSKRFPGRAEQLGLFRFFAHNSVYTTTSSVLAPNQCQSCHVKFASKEYYVFTDTHAGLTSSIIHQQLLIRRAAIPRKRKRYANRAWKHDHEDCGRSHRSCVYGHRRFCGF
jgi:hypothetical protein